MSLLTQFVKIAPHAGVMSLKGRRARLQQTHNVCCVCPVQTTSTNKVPATLPQIQFVLHVQRVESISMPVQYAVTIQTLCAMSVHHVIVENLSGWHVAPSQILNARLVVNARLVKHPHPTLGVKGRKTLNVRYVQKGNINPATAIKHVTIVSLLKLHQQALPQKLTVDPMHSLKV